MENLSTGTGPRGPAGRAGGTVRPGGGDFTSALFLGLTHPPGDLRPWRRLTTGVPAVLGVPRAAVTVARRIAALTGGEAAVLARSTLHGLLDAVPCAAGRTGYVLLDSGTYPVARWAAAGAGCPVGTFSHHDPAALAAAVARHPGRRPVVLADGLCVACGPVPLAAYLRILRPYGGLVVLDDTQAMGLLGTRAPDTRDVYGRGGGGSLRWHGVDPARVLVVASLAKAFGAPLAVVVGPGELIGALARSGQARAHTSPPSCADVRAAGHALDVNAADGDRLRRRLAGLVGRFRHRVRAAGLPLGAGQLPVQRVPLGVAGPAVRRRLAGAGVRTVLARVGGHPEVAVTFAVSTRHRARDIDAAAEALAEAVRVEGAGAGRTEVGAGTASRADVPGGGPARATWTRGTTPGRPR
ncbi:aminotransferase class I/II-fold pyridoxal phosphate-dependent enzyme [Longispora urticae]